jgi:hypothetical protein
LSASLDTGPVLGIRGVGVDHVAPGTPVFLHGLFVGIDTEHPIPEALTHEVIGPGTDPAHPEHPDGCGPSYSGVRPG